MISKTSIRLLTLSSALLSSALLISTSPLIAADLFEIESSPSRLEYRAAANYTYLKWLPQRQSSVNINLLPIQNYSGIPTQERDEKSDYYYHGKIPQDTQNLFADLISASRYFNPVESNTKARKTTAYDYQFQLTIERYQLPFDYAPNDVWWKELNADVDRWFVSPKNANIKLSLKVNSGKKYISSWSQSIETTLSNCDLNLQTQPLTAKENSNNVITEYAQTTLGQAFISASNYLILQAIHHISQQRRLAKVITNEHNELFIKSEDSTFKIGEKLELYYNSNDGIQSALPAGEIEVIKTYKNQAVAYPVDLRTDQIKPGDWIEVSEIHPYQSPKFSFTEKNNCAQVTIAQNNRVN